MPCVLDKAYIENNIGFNCYVVRSCTSKNNLQNQHYYPRAKSDFFMIEVTAHNIILTSTFLNSVCDGYDFSNVASYYRKFKKMMRNPSLIGKNIQTRRKENLLLNRYGYIII